MNKKFKLSILKTNEITKFNEALIASRKHWNYSEDYLTKFAEIFSIDMNYFNNAFIKKLTTDSRLIGAYSFSKNSDDNIELDHLFLTPKYIGQNLGLFLWEDVIKTINENGHSKVIIWSDKNAEGFYSKIGCQKIGYRKPLIEGRDKSAVFEYIIE